MSLSRSDRSPAYLAYLSVILLMVGALLSWQAWSRNTDFRNFHRQLATIGVKGGADEIEVLLGELHRSMQLFAADRPTLLAEIQGDSDNDLLWGQLENAVREHFPEYFGMTLTDANGNVLRPDFDNLVEEVCQQDIHEFIGKGYELQGHIHPNPLGYHFDIMVPWGSQANPSGVFFLSFQPAMLSRILARLQPPGHTLLLLQRDRPGLIEVTGAGSRDTLQREFFLDEDELARIAASTPVSDSHWILVDMPHADLYLREATSNWTYAGTVFGVFVVITLLLLHLLRRKEWHRIQAEELALRHQSELAHVDRLNTLGEMASGIAHELSQPLSAISTYCQSGLRMLEGLSEVPDKLVHALRESSLQAKRAGMIIHRMKEFSAKGKTQHAPVEINRVIRTAAGFIGPELDKHATTLQLDLAPGLPVVMADSIQLEQVILNLLNNAIEAMTAADSPTRRLTVSSRQADTGHVDVSVRDSGPGLDPETIDRMFDAFFSTRNQGMGLGLAISRSIIEAHGGRLWAVSNPDAGSTFWFSLPVEETR
jgi:C4-dicarboxylate-specific signal transduction histidine kinase